MKKLVLISLIVSACGSHPTITTITAPSRPVVAIQYDINIPIVSVALGLQNVYPNGIQITPVQAQRDYNYTATYGGSPNVYIGMATALPQGIYIGAGVVEAPIAAASKMPFQASDWPGLNLRADTDYTWLGHFVATQTKDGFK